MQLRSRPRRAGAELSRYVVASLFFLAGCSSPSGPSNPSDTAADPDVADALGDTSSDLDAVLPDVRDTSRFDAVDADEDADAVSACDSGLSVCENGNLVCADDGMLAQDCETELWGGCLDGACLGPCTLAETVDSELGCAFLAANLPVAGVAQPWVGLSLTNPGPAEARAVVTDSDGTVLAELEVPSRGTQTVYVSPDTAGGTARASQLSSAGILVTTDSPVSIVQRAAARGDVYASTDTSLLFPVHTLRGSTTVVGWPDSVSTPVASHEPSHATSTTIVSGADSVRVTLRMAAETAPGDGVPGVRTGDDLVVQLDALETLHVETAFLGQDLTGTIVESSGPVAVFTSARSAAVPAPTYLCPAGAPADPISGRCCDGGVFPTPEGICPDGRRGGSSLALDSPGSSSDTAPARVPRRSEVCNGLGHDRRQRSDLADRGLGALAGPRVNPDESARG